MKKAHDILAFIQGSPFSAETKEKVKNLIGGQETITHEVYALITDIIQDEIDGDLSEFSLLKEDQDNLDTELVQGLDAVEKELADDISWMEKELDELDEINNQISQQEDTIAIQGIKQSI
jgi:hypothetical protein